MPRRKSANSLKWSSLSKRSPTWSNRPAIEVVLKI
nr:MAG TPA: hypothetical protein [Caudoviricetes sp.]